MAKELAKKATELVSSISSASTGGLSTRPSRVPYDQVPGESRDHTVCSDEVLAERASRAGKLTGGISSGGLSTRPSRKAYGDIKSPFGEPEKPSASPLKTMGEDTEVGSTKADAGEPGTMMLGVKLQGAERWRAWGAVALFTLLTMMQDIGTFMPNYLNEKMQADIGMTDAQYGLIQGYAYWLVYGVFMIAAGYITDKYKLNRVYVVAIGSSLTGVALVIEGMAQNFTMFLGGIVMNALTSSVNQNIPYAILSDLLPPEQLSLGGAILASAIYLGEAITGNVAYLAILKGISWRWPVVICGVALSAVSVAVALLVKEPPVGKFVNRKKDEGPTSMDTFNSKASMLYLVSMTTFWILTVAAGFRYMSGNIVAAYVPDFNQQLFPEQTTVFAAEASIVGVCGFLASAYVGLICERLFTRVPQIALYTTAIGSFFAAAFMTLAVHARFIRRDSSGGYGIFLTSLALSILFSEGWGGPITCLVTLILPPEIKAFGLSVWSAIANIISPAGSVLFGIYLTAGGWASGTPGWLPAARVFLLGSLVFGYLFSATLFLLSARLIHRDKLRLETVCQSGSLDSVAPSRARKWGTLVGVAVLAAATLTLVAVSLIFSYDPEAMLHKG